MDAKHWSKEGKHFSSQYQGHDTLRCSKRQGGAFLLYQDHHINDVEFLMIMWWICVVACVCISIKVDLRCDYTYRLLRMNEFSE